MRKITTAGIKREDVKKDKVKDKVMDNDKVKDKNKIHSLLWKLYSFIFIIEFVAFLYLSIGSFIFKDKEYYLKIAAIKILLITLVATSIIDLIIKKCRIRGVRTGTECIIFSIIKMIGVAIFIYYSYFRT